MEKSGDVTMDGSGFTKDTVKTVANERRSVGRRKVAETAWLFFGERGMIACGARDLSRMGAGIRLQNVNVLPATARRSNAPAIFCMDSATTRYSESPSSVKDIER